MLLCPPFGWEDMCSYRARRWWAEVLAEAGHPVLRFDLPATGDSTGSPHDPGLVGIWTEAIERLASELAACHQVPAVAAIGIGLGGALALRSADRGAPISQVALWAVPTNGRRLVRELRAAAALIPPPIGADPIEGADGWLELTGYLLTEATSADLGAFELAVGRTSAPRRVLVLGRDGITVDPSFVDSLRAAGAEVVIDDGIGYGPMMADPEKSRIPEETIAATVGWLAAERGPAGAASPDPGIMLGRGEPLVDTVSGVRITERAISVPSPGGDLFAVLCLPADAPAGGESPGRVAAVLLNGGAQRHTGQNRNWVETARRWAAVGVPSLRVDLPGIGDAGGQGAGPLASRDIYDAARTEQVLAAVGWLRTEGIAERFLLAGICAGAHWAYHAALADASIAGVGLINLFSFDWTPTLGSERARRATIRALRGDLWKKLRHGDRRRAAVTRSLRTLSNIRALEQTRRAQKEQASRVGGELETLDARGCEVALLIGRNEPLAEELRSFGVLERLPGWQRIRLQEFGWEDHAVRALASQRLVGTLLDDLLARVRTTGATAPPSVVGAPAAASGR